MNFIMIIGISIIFGAIIWAVYIQLKDYFDNRGTKKESAGIKKSWTWKKRVIFLLIALSGGIVVQYGDNIRKMTFTKEELIFLQENKSFSSFNESDLSTYIRAEMTFSHSKPEIFEKYYNQFLEWKTDRYIDSNKRRDITREQAKKFVDKNMKFNREVYMTKYCKRLCKLTML